MSGVPTINFGQSENGLFSPEEILRLMQAEFVRSTRYDYPLALFLVEIDRLESLHDLYGIESRERIVRSVVSLLRSSTRASDVLGCLRDDRLMALFPHTPREAALAIARRVTAGCRELEFKSDGRSLRATLSIGLCQRAPDGDFAQLVAGGEAALTSALEAGGDRFVEFEKLPRRSSPTAFPIPAAPVPPVRPARARPAPAAPPLPDVGELAGTTLEEKVQNLLALLGSGDPGLAAEVVAAIQGTVSEVRGRALTQTEVEREIRGLEARVARLKELLEASEEDLARMVQEKSLDPGIASIYRTVQGLAAEEDQREAKAAMLTRMFQDNLVMQHKVLVPQPAPAPATPPAEASITTLVPQQKSA